MSAYGFTEDSARRIARVVKSVEGDTTEPTRIGPMLGGSTMSVVKVTALGSPLNTGQRVDYHASADTMNDINEVKIREVSGAALTVGSRYMGQFSGYTSAGLPVFVVKTSTASGGSATIEVVTDVICTPTGIEVSTVTLSGADYDNAVIKQFLALTDVTPASYLGNQGRVVKVNDAATALEFGAIGEGPSYTTFIALSDSPATYGSSSTYYSLTVNSANSALVFSANNVTTTNSLTGGGNPNAPAWTALKLVNDTATPGNDRFYATTNAGAKGWRTLTLKGATDFPANYTSAGGKFLKVNSGATAVEFSALTLTGATDFPANYTSAGGKFLKVNAGATAVEFVGPLAAVTDVAAHTISSADLATAVSTTQTAIDDLKTQVNLLLARIRSQGLIS